jgi:hypothetical protein
MPQRYHRFTHRAMHRRFMTANVFERKQMCREIHPGTKASECPVYKATVEQNLCDADPVGGLAMCRRFEVERKTEEKNLVLVEGMDLSEARRVAAANHSYKLTAALACHGRASRRGRRCHCAGDFQGSVSCCYVLSRSSNRLARLHAPIAFSFISQV